MRGYQAKTGVRERLALTGVFTGAALRYWLTVFPRVCRELAGWRRRAGGIADPALRGLALDALNKRGNIEGAAAFAAFVPRTHRGVAIRALVAFQAAYNYLDMLAEQPSPDPADNARRLHEALLVALDPAAAHLDYYEHHPQRDDGGYLAEMVDVCRGALGVLPSYAAVAEPARRAAARIVAFQALSVGERSQLQGAAEQGAPVEGAAGKGMARGDDEALKHWACGETPTGTGLEWWETAAAAGSSLGVHVLIAAAGDTVIDPGDVAAIEDAYFPWIGSLHSLLDSLVDSCEDTETGQLSLIGCYATHQDAVERMGWIATQAVRAARGLPRGRRHMVIVAGMAGYYLSTAKGSTPDTLAIAQGVREAIGCLAGPTLLVFATRGVDP
jgi:tetraprenyl-beta-curcumene synthase